MNLSQQVCSLPLAERLEELLPRRECLFAYYGNAGTWHADGIVDMTMYQDVDDEFKKHKLLPAYTVAELGEMLPQGTVMPCKDSDGRWKDVGGAVADALRGMSSEHPYIEADTEADARAKMLVYLLENKLITV